MSKQMTCDWVEQEYEKWRKNVHDPSGQTERSQYVAQLFALHMLELSSYYNTGLKSTAQQNINSTKNGNLHVKPTAQNE